MGASSRSFPLSALTRCLEEEAAAIAASAHRLDGQQVESALELLDRCAATRAKLVITGVGKSGIVARKIAATFSSIGLMAIFLNPVDALHGDLGVVACNSRGKQKTMFQPPPLTLAGVSRDG